MAVSDCTCATCGATIPYKGNGRPPKYCAPACRPSAYVKKGRHKVVVTKPCVMCGVQMSGPPAAMNRRKVCSVACQHAKFSRIGTSPEWGSCLTCGKAMLRTSVRTTLRDGTASSHLKKFCSSRCRFDAQVVDKSWVAEAVEYAKPHCKTCSATVPRLGMRYCSRQCAKPIAGRRQCSYCDAWYEPGNWLSNCCGAESCRGKHKAATADKARKSPKGRANKKKAKTIRRARGRIKAESIDPIAVFERDGWKCRLCGVRTPRSLRGSCDPRAPELDHIQSLAAGGSHTWTNVQCACRACNIEKGARCIGQFNFPFNVPAAWRTGKAGVSRCFH